MKIYQVIINDTMIDYVDDTTYNRNETLNFLSSQERDAYLDGYLYPFLDSYDKDEKIDEWYWFGVDNKFKVIYSYELNEFDFEIIKSIPYREERKQQFINNVYNKHIDDYNKRLVQAIDNPIRFKNMNSSPTRFDLNFPKLKIY